MDLQLAGDVTVVFGAARGLGHAFAAGFAAEGARVVLADLSPAVADAVGIGSGKFGFPFWNREEAPGSPECLVF